jgi:hypothetical protein
MGSRSNFDVLGRGGAEHKYLQHLISRLDE